MRERKRESAIVDRRRRLCLCGGLLGACLATANTRGAETAGTSPAQSAEAPLFGGTPRPGAEVREKFDRWVRQVADPENTLDLIVGKPRLLILKQAPQKVQIPDDHIALYDVLSDREISVTGTAVGTTVLNLWFEDKNAASGRALLSYFVRVTPDPEARGRLERAYQALAEEINKAMPDSRVTLKMVGDNLLVRGQAKDASEADEIMRIVEANSAVETAEIPVDLPDAAASAPAGSGPVAPAGRGLLKPAQSGAAGQSRQKPRGNDEARRGGKSRFINLLRVPGESQVMLRVTVAEVNRSAARSIGLNFSIANSKGVQVLSNLTGALATFGKGSVNTSVNLPMLLDSGQLGVALDALRTLNLAKSLAEPNLVAVNGQTARFQAGGEFPVPVVTGATSTGLQGVQFVPFGVQLGFTPYLTEKDRIRLVFDAEVSTRDAAGGTTINGANVPGVTTRNIQTTVDLKPGQTLAVAGLIQQNYGASGSRIPFFGDMPVLSSLLGSNQTSSAEQELVILINAELVRPLDSRDLPPLPGHDIYEPDDLEFFIGGRLEASNGPDFRSSTRTDFDRLTRSRRFQRTYLIGPSGHADDRTGAAAAPGGPATKESGGNK